MNPPPAMVRIRWVIASPQTWTAVSTPTLPVSIITSRRAARKPCLRAERRKTSKNRDVQQFPGEPAATNLLDDSKGVTIGLTSLITPRLINDFHWGFVRQGQQYGGTSVYPGIFLSGIRQPCSLHSPHDCFCARQPVERQFELDSGKSHVSVRYRLISDSQQSPQLPELVLRRSDQCGLSQHGRNR